MCVFVVPQWLEQFAKQKCKSRSHKIGAAIRRDDKEFVEFLGSRADLNLSQARRRDILEFWEQQKATSSHQLAHIFSLAQCGNGDDGRGGPVFDVEFAQDVFDVLADRPGACAEDHADLIIRFTLCDQSQNLRLARGETQ